MAKDTLEKKIKMVCWWALGLTILYFLIGAWLISDGPNFDSIKTYNLLKDTLTLTAAFLAPAAAFVLFSDWREEHQIKIMHGLVDEIKSVTHDIENELKQYMYKIYHPDRLVTDEFTTSKESLKLLTQLTILSRLYLEFNVSNEDTEIFKQHIDSLGKCAKLAKNALDRMDWASYKREQIEKATNGVERFEGEEEFHLEFFRKENITFELNFQMIKQLNEQLIIFGNIIKTNA